MASLVITVAIPASTSRDIELSWSQRAVALAIEQARNGGGQVLNGTMLTDGAVSLGTWSYSPTAPS
jgi:hypothetical protein